MVPDDGDIVKGLGFVTLYSAWVEEAVDDLLRLLAPVEPFSKKRQMWPISQKLKLAARLVRRIASPQLEKLPLTLGAGLALFERRNQVIHGRIYVGHDKTKYIKSGRRNAATRPITSAELYALANDFLNYRGAVIGPKWFRLPGAVRGFVNSAS